VWEILFSSSRGNHRRWICWRLHWKLSRSF